MYSASLDVVYTIHACVSPGPVSLFPVKSIPLNTCREHHAENAILSKLNCSKTTLLEDASGDILKEGAGLRPLAERHFASTFPAVCLRASVRTSLSEGRWILNK